jgi:hypothetical protein
VAPAFKQFFAATTALKYLNMSHGKLPVEALKALLLGLACNEATADVELNISSNNLGAGGATVMENALPGVKCVSRLDVSGRNDNPGENFTLPNSAYTLGPCAEP